MIKNSIPISKPSVGEAEVENVEAAVNSGMLAFGTYQEEFITRLARFHDVDSRNVVLVSNGTVALHLALATLKIGKGDEVIIPATSFVATLNAVLYTGATPVFVDIEPASWGIDVNKIEAAISDKTKAIIPVHLYGNPCYIAEIINLANRRGIKVIEDNAESLGASVKGQLTGTFGDCGTYSFYGNKVITTGEGGAIIFRSEKLAARAKVLASHGMSPDKRYFHEEIGFNYRMTNIQAAIGSAQMTRIDEILSERKRIMSDYNAALGQAVRTVFNESADFCPVNWLYTIIVDRPQVIEEKLQLAGIDSRRTFVPLNELPYVADGVIHKNSRFLFDHGISLPTYVGLPTDQINRISEIIRAYV